MSGIYLSIVIPAYNERRRLPDTLQKIERWRESVSYQTEVLVVDDGGRDGTAEYVSGEGSARPWLRLISYPQNRGKGYAVKCGMLNGMGELLLIYDADGSTPIEELARLLPEIDQGADIVIGSRAIYSPDTKLETDLHRKLFGRVFNWTINLLAVPGISDTQCGFKLFRREVGQKLFRLQRSAGFSFDVEILFLAQHFGYKIREVAINWHHEDGSKVSLFKDGLSMLFDVLKFRRWWASRLYAE